MSKRASASSRNANSSAQRQTPQRDAILRVIQDSNGPLSVPEIHERARRSLPQIGIATIYRTLKLLQESDQILVVILPSGETRYENTGLGHHDHFQCRRCRSVFDLADCPLHLDRGTALPGGFIVEDHEMTLYGTCPDCALLSVANQNAPATVIAKQAEAVKPLDQKKRADQKQLTP